MSERLKISEEWLCASGFKWHQPDGQDRKHWLLWLGDAIRDGNGFCSFEDLGVEVAEGRDGLWFCWLRADYAGRYSRFIHVRHLRFVDELAALIEGITGWPLEREHCQYGSMRSPKDWKALREADERLDLRWLRESRKWREIEEDNSRGRALPEHYDFHERARGTVTNFEKTHASFGWIDGRLQQPGKEEAILFAGPAGVGTAKGDAIGWDKLRWWMPLPKAPEEQR